AASASSASSRSSSRARGRRENFGVVKNISGVRLNAAALLPEDRIVFLNSTVLRLGVDNAPVIGIGSCVEAVARMELEPVVIQDAIEVATVTRPTPVSAVLQSAIHE